MARTFNLALAEQRFRAEQGGCWLDDNLITYGANNKHEINFLLSDDTRSQFYMSDLEQNYVEKDEP